MRLMEGWRQLGGLWWWWWWREWGEAGGGCWRVLGSDCLSIPVCVPPGGTNVSFEQFVDSPLSSWPALIQTGSIFWTLGMPRTSRGHQCVIQMPWLHSHHLLLCSWISGLVFWWQCSRCTDFLDKREQKKDFSVGFAGTFACTRISPPRIDDKNDWLLKILDHWHYVKNAKVTIMIMIEKL